LQEMGVVARDGSCCKRWELLQEMGVVARGFTTY